MRNIALPSAPRKSAIVDGSGFPMTMPTTAHQAADATGQDLRGYRPRYVSPDAAWLPERTRVVSRIHDLARNDGWTSSTLQRYVDQAIGASFRLSYRPDYMALGIKFDDAFEFTQDVESKWRQYANDPRCFVDAQERLSFSGLAGLLFRHRMADGECFALLRWLDRPWFDSRTAVHVISPERISNNQGAMDTPTLRGGVEMNQLGAPIAYWVRSVHPGEDFTLQMAQNFFTWTRVPRRTAWGRPIVIHYFETDEAGQTRGKSPLATVVKKIFMANRHADAELQAAVLNASLAAVLESPLDPENIAGAFDDASELKQYEQARDEFHEKSPVTVNGVRITHTFPGEKLSFVNAARPNANYAGFEERTLRYIATATGQSYEQLAADFSKTNYSSARAALQEWWKFISARRDGFAQGVCTPIFAAWFEESVDSGLITLPSGAPDLWDAYAAYTACDWAGPGRGWVDPVKEAEAVVMRMNAGVSTLRDEAEDAGTDWREVAKQRAFEVRYYADLGLPVPSTRLEPVMTPQDADPGNTNIDAKPDDDEQAPANKDEPTDSSGAGPGATRRFAHLPRRRARSLIPDVSAAA